MKSFFSHERSQMFPQMIVNRVKSHKGKPFRVCFLSELDTICHRGNFQCVGKLDTYTLILRWRTASWQKFLRQSRVAFNASHQGRCAEKLIKQGACFSIVFAVTVFDDCGLKKKMEMKREKWWTYQHVFVVNFQKRTYQHVFVVNSHKGEFVITFLWWIYKVVNFFYKFLLKTKLTIISIAHVAQNFLNIRRLFLAIQERFAFFRGCFVLLRDTVGLRFILWITIVHRRSLCFTLRWAFSDFRWWALSNKFLFHFLHWTTSNDSRCWWWGDWLCCRFSVILELFDFRHAVNTTAWTFSFTRACLVIRVDFIVKIWWIGWILHRFALDNGWFSIFRIGNFTYNGSSS